MTGSEFSWKPFLLNAHLAVVAGLIAGVVVEVARVAESAIKLVGLSVGFTIVMILLSAGSYYAIHVLFNQDRHNGAAWVIFSAYILLTFAFYGFLSTIQASRFS